MKFKFKKGAEATSYPYWVIIDKNCSLGFDGIWFSRESAETYLKFSEKYSQDAYVFCKSGCYSKDFINLIEGKL